MERGKIKAEHLLMLVVSFFWALGHPLGRIILEKIHPFQLGAVTLTTGWIGLLLFMVFTGRTRDYKKLSVRDSLISLGLGIFGFFFYQILTFSALSRIPASMNAVLVSTNVVFIALMAALFLRERIGMLKAGGILLALSGVVLVTFNRGFSLNQNVNLAGCSFALMAALSFSLYSVFGKKILSHNDPLIVASLALCSGSVFLILLTISTVGFAPVVSAGPATLGLMLLLGLTMIGIAYPLWFTCLKRLPASHASIYIYLTPVFAIILSLIILKESFSWLFWLGGAFILAGIILINMLVKKNIQS